MWEIIKYLFVVVVMAVCIFVMESNTSNGVNSGAKRDTVLIAPFILK